MRYLQDVPPAAGEKETLAALLDLQREAVIAHCEGCSDEDLRKRLVDSETTILGIVKHLGFVERWWFGKRFAGDTLESLARPMDPTAPTQGDWDADFRIEADESTDLILDFYRQEIDRSRAIVAATDLETRAVDRPDVTLRWVMCRVIWDTARHAGQADILRELVDGTTGLGFTGPAAVDELPGGD